MFDGTSWTPNVQIPGQKSKAAPALAFDGTVLHLIHQGDSSNDLWHSKFDGANWSPNIKVAEEKSKAPAALAMFAGRVHMVHLGDTSNDLWHSRLDFGAASLTPQIVHEICHAAGVVHEQSREDRDWFVMINEDAIQKGKEHNYEKRNDEAEDSGLYDYDSLMHYGPFFFAKTTMTPVITQGIATSGFTGAFANIGNAAGLSANDIETLFALYPRVVAERSNSRPGKSRDAGSRGVRGPVAPCAHRKDLERSLAFHVRRRDVERQRQDSRPEEQVTGGARACSTACSIWYTSAIPRTTSGTPYSTGRRGRPTSRSRTRRARSLRSWRSSAGASTWCISAIRRTTSGIRRSTERRGRRTFASPASPARQRRRWPIRRCASHGPSGDSSNDLWHSTFDGAPWSTNVRIKNQASKGAPALATSGGRLQLSIWRLVESALALDLRRHLAAERADRTPIEFGRTASARFNLLIMVHVGSDSTDLWHSAHTR